MSWVGSIFTDAKSKVQGGHVIRRGAAGFFCFSFSKGPKDPDSLALQTWPLVWALQWTSVPSRAGWLPVDTQEGVGKSKLAASGEEAMSFL